MVDGVTQVKFTIESDIVSAFKARCAAEGVSMASVIRLWMATRQPAKDAKAKICTRPGRRRAVAEYIGLLNAVMEKEEQYRDSIPEQFAQRYEAADHACGQLAEAIELLEDAY
jgi:esterase/lipase